MVAANFVCFLGISLVVGIGLWNKKRGRLNEKKVALLLIGYMTVFVLVTLFPIFQPPTVQGLLTIIVLLSVLWLFGYPWVCWLYKMFIPPGS